MKTFDMRRTDKDKKADHDRMMQPMEVYSPDFHHGLHVTLDDASLKKVGINKLPGIGTKYRMAGGMTVTEANDPALSGNGDRRLHLVMHNLGMERDGDADDDDDGKSIREELEDARHQARGTTAKEGRIGARVATAGNNEC